MNLWSQDKGQKECVDVHAKCDARRTMPNSTG